MRLYTYYILYYKLVCTFLYIFKMAHIFHSPIWSRTYTRTIQDIRIPWVFVLKHIIWWCRVSMTICFQVNNVWETWGPSKNNTIGSISFLFPWRQRCIWWNIIYYIIWVFSVRLKFVRRISPEAKQFFSDPFTYLFFWQRDFLYFLRFFQSSLVTE